MEGYRTEDEIVKVIKAWWQKRGKLLTTVLTIALLMLLGSRYYTHHQNVTIAKASNQYDLLLTLSKENKDRQQVLATANNLKNDFPKTIYAKMAALIAAKSFIENEDYNKAKTELNWILESDNGSLTDALARIRLSRIYLAEKQYDRALQVLDSKINDSFLAAVYEVKGDIYKAKNDSVGAKEQYKLALDKSLPNAPLRSIVEIKLQNI